MARTSLLLLEFVKYEYTTEEYLQEALTDYADQIAAGNMPDPIKEKMLIMTAFRIMQQMKLALEAKNESEIIRTGKNLADLKLAFQAAVGVARKERNLEKENHYTNLDWWIQTTQDAFAEAEQQNQQFNPQPFNPSKVYQPGVASTPSHAPIREVPQAVSNEISKIPLNIGPHAGRTKVGGA